MDFMKQKVRMAKPYGKFKVGEEVTIEQLIPKDGMHEQKSEKTGKVQYKTMKHWVVELLADLTGLKETEKAEFIVLPTIDNMMTCVVRRYLAVPNWKDGKMEGYQDPLYEIGESSSKTVHNGYPVYMAYKRAFDRVALNCLGGFDMYSDIESEEFRGIKDVSIDALREDQRAKAIQIEKILKKVVQMEQLEKVLQQFEDAVVKEEETLQDGQEPLYDDLMKKMVRGMIDLRKMEIQVL